MIIGCIISILVEPNSIHGIYDHFLNPLYALRNGMHAEFKVCWTQL